MKNLKVKNKLTAGFSIVLFFTMLVAFIGILGLNTMNAGGEELYNRNVAGINKAYEMLVNLTIQRTEYRNIILSLEQEYEGTVDEAVGVLRKTEQNMQELMEDYSSWAKLPKAIEAFNKYKNYYGSLFHDSKEHLITCVQNGDKTEAMHALIELGPEYDQLSVDLHAIVEANVESAADTAGSNRNTFNMMLIIQIVIFVVTAVIAVFLTIYLSIIICRPLRVLMEYMQEAGATGYMTPTAYENAVFTETSQRKDELGKCITASMGFVNHIMTIAKELEIVADGDLSNDFELLSSRDEMGLSLGKMTKNLNLMFAEVNSASHHVADGSKHVADGSQSLSVSSSEQAAAIEQLGSSVNGIASNTARNADMARDAANLSGVIKVNAEKGSSQMEQMMGAVKEINDASNSISRVIKVIDDIAFQTNILALNAAVEAARAGQHGKGFAVVAEEVRNLAAKSAEAAKDTSSLIANSMEKAQLGAKIAAETAASLEDIVEGINKSSEIIFEISRLSDEQASSISQINAGIDNVADMIQQTSAVSEESAAASEEMSGQATMLLELVKRFKIKDYDSHTIAATVKKALSAPNHAAPDDNFGKY